MTELTAPHSFVIIENMYSLLFPATPLSLEFKQVQNTSDFGYSGYSLDQEFLTCDSWLNGA